MLKFQQPTMVYYPGACEKSSLKVPNARPVVVLSYRPLFRKGIFGTCKFSILRLLNLIYVKFTPSAEKQREKAPESRCNRKQKRHVKNLFR